MTLPERFLVVTNHTDRLCSTISFNVSMTVRVPDPSRFNGFVSMGRVELPISGPLSVESNGTKIRLIAAIGPETTMGDTIDDRLSKKAAVSEGRTTITSPIRTARYSSWCWLKPLTISLARTVSDPCDPNDGARTGDTLSDSRNSKPDGTS